MLTNKDNIEWKPLDALYSINIITPPYVFAPGKRVQYRFPKSKKKRIRKKWAKNPKNWKVIYDEDRIYEMMLDGRKTIVISPKMLEKIKQKLNEHFYNYRINSIYCQFFFCPDFGWRNWW